MPRLLRRQSWVVPLAGALLAALALVAWARHDEPPVPMSVRLGYAHDPPYMFRGDDGRPRGLDIDVLAEAATRAHVAVSWVYVTAKGGADEALAARAVDLWPALTILEERRRAVHFTDPWLRTEVLLVVRDGGPRPPGDYAGPMGVVQLPVATLMAGRNLPRARLVRFPDGAALVDALCRGDVPMALLSAGIIAQATAEPTGPCRAARLRSYGLLDSTLHIAIAARVGYEEVANRLRARIDEMAADGSIRSIVSPYSFHAANEVLGVYELLQERARTRFFTWGTVVLGAAFLGSSALFGALLRANRRARQSLIEKAALEERLQAAQRLELVGQFTGGVAHDFNNLVTIIVGYASVAAERAHADPLVAHALSEIHKAGERANDLVRHLLTLGRKQATEPRVIAVHDEVQGLRPMLRQLLGSRVQVELDLAAEDDRILMDPGEFSRVLLNLAANAVDAMPDGGRIRITTTTCGLDAERAMCLVFADNGSGMPAAVRTRVFEPFFTTKASGRGTGLGLSVVHGIVREAGGTIAVESEPGAGTRFEIRWPLAPIPVPEVAVAPASAAATPSGPTDRTVLVVEDRDELRMLVVRVLTGAGYHVLSATDGASGLALLQAHAADVDLVVSDLMMPRLSGPALLEQARRAGLGTPFLFITGHAGEAVAALEAERVLAKPFSPPQLLDAVQALIARPA